MYQTKYVTLVAFWWLVIANGNVVRNEDICGVHNGRRLYLELGEKGTLYARNVSFVKNSPRQDLSRVYVSNSSHHQCKLELVTCPSCVIIVTFKSLALPHHCGDGSVVMDSPCRCDYVWLSEPPYEDVSGAPFCGLYSPITYRSNTRTLSIALLYSQSHEHPFTLEYTAERNRMHLKGTEIMNAKGPNNTAGGILTSPFFPARYPRDLGMEYIITCPTDAPLCRVRLLFSDFQLATVSIMEFYDWNGQRLDVSSGARFRPPIIVSSGPSLIMRFYANGGTGLGYKAFYSFVIGHLYDKSIQPITDCGGYVENLGGAITMMDMVGQGVKTYDCVWLIRPPKNFLHMKTHMYLKVIAFEDMAGNTELTIRQGPTSALMPLEVLRHPASQLQPPRQREHVTPVTNGFHVSFRGTFGPTSHLAIAYTTFNYMDCFAGSDYLCQNHRCIPSQLNCDGFDHCGDNSDEPATCFRDWDDEPQDRKWHTNKPNYYFPKIDRYPDLKTATLVFVASSLGLIILISALIILLYRMGARARQQRELQSRLQTISELLVYSEGRENVHRFRRHRGFSPPLPTVFDITDGAQIDEISVTDDPPVYEAPPGYDEVVKLTLESDGIRRKKKRNANRETRNRNSSGQCSSEQDVQSTSRLMENASTSRSSQTTPIPPTVKQQQQRIPESPPPPYVTPPGTMRNMNIVSIPSPRCAAERLCIRSARARRAWLRRSGEFSHSLPTNEDHPATMFSTSIDAEILGSFLQDQILINRPIENNAEQSSSHQQVIEVIPKPEITWDNQEIDVRNNQTTTCSCEGACGCANDEAVLNEVNVPSQSNEICQDTSNQDDQSKRFDQDQRSDQEEEEGSFAKNTIIRLLGGKANKPFVRGNFGSSSTSTASSTPSNSLGRSFRKLSECSRDSYVTRISNVSSCNSYEKLQDEIEVISETASTIGATTGANTPVPSTPIPSTPSGTPRIVAHRTRSCPGSRYSNCDMDSLYEGIRILDSYMARRASCLSVRRSRKPAVAVMIFGTPEHTSRRFPGAVDDAEISRRRARIWRFSDDTLSN